MRTNPLAGQERVDGPGAGRPDGPGGPDEVDLTGTEEAVELLLEEVGEETEPEPSAPFAELRGRTAVITGGATGIGRAAAIEFARRGTNVAFNWIDLPGRSVSEAAARTRAELQQLEVSVHVEQVDVRDAGAVAGFIGRVHSRLGGPHYLINAAGVHRSAPVWKMGEEEWREVLDTNLTGAFNTVRAVAPIFREQKMGKVVNVASVQAFQGRFGASNYAASKAGLVGFTRAVAADLGPFNVNVNAVAPGFVRTEMLSDIPAARVHDAVEDAALRRISEPEDVAHLILFLCSELARQITGEVVRVDGGMLR